MDAWTAATETRRHLAGAVTGDKRSARNFLLDDENGNGPVASRRVLDDRPQRSRRRLPTAEIVASLENILSAGGHEPPSAATAPARAQVHDDRSMVLGRRC